MQRNFFDSKNNGLPVEIITNHIIPYLPLNNLLSFSETNKDLNITSIDSIFKAGKKEIRHKLHNRFLTFWSFRPKLTYDDNEFYSRQITHFIKNAKLDFWQKLLSYRLLKIFGKSNKQQTDFLQILALHDNTLLSSLEIIFSTLTQSPISQELFIQYINELFFEKICHESILKSLSKFLDNLVHKSIIPQSLCNKLIELGIDHLHDDDPRYKLSAAILLTQLYRHSKDEYNEKIFTALEANLFDEVYATDRLDNLKVIRLLKNLIVKLEPDQILQLLETLFSDLLLQPHLIRTASLETLICFSDFFETSQLLDIHSACFKTIEEDNAGEFYSSCRDVMLSIVTHKLFKDTFIKEINSYITELNQKPISFQHYNLAKIFAEYYCNHSNILLDELIGNTLVNLDSTNEFLSIIAIHTLKNLANLFPQTKVSAIQERLLSIIQNMKVFSVSSAVDALGELQSYENADQFTIVYNQLSSLLSDNSDSMIKENAIFALAKCINHMSITQHNNTAKILLNLISSPSCDTFVYVAAMKTIKYFKSSLSSEQLSQLAQVFSMTFQNRTRGELSEIDYETLLTSVTELQDYVENISDPAKLVNHLLDLVSKLNNYAIIEACYKSISICLPKLPSNAVKDLYIKCIQTLRSHSTEALITLIEQCTIAMKEEQTVNKNAMFMNVDLKMEPCTFSTTTTDQLKIFPRL